MKSERTKPRILNHYYETNTLWGRAAVNLQDKVLIWRWSSMAVRSESTSSTAGMEGGGVYAYADKSEIVFRLIISTRARTAALQNSREKRAGSRVVSDVGMEGE